MCVTKQPQGGGVERTTHHAPRACQYLFFSRRYYDVESWAARSAEQQYDVRIEEIVRSTHLPAWRASVQGPECNVATCDDSFASWKMCVSSLV